MSDIYLDNKSAEIKATRDEDFYYAWKVNGKVISVEYVPMNWPAVTVVITDENDFGFKEQVDLLKEVGYEIEGEDGDEE